MKKLLVFLICAVTACSFLGCGGNDKIQGSSTNNESPSYKDALQVLTTVLDTYGEDEKFPIGGGDSEHMTTDAPGTFDVSKKDELNTILALPESEASHIDNAASMIHMMNANTFTGAAYHLTKDADMNTFAAAVRDHVLSKQWICGMPDTLVIIQVNNEYVVTAYGADDLIQTFKKHTLESLKGSKILIEESVVENGI